MYCPLHTLHTTIPISSWAACMLHITSYPFICPHFVIFIFHLHTAWIILATVFTNRNPFEHPSARSLHFQLIQGENLNTFKYIILWEFYYISMCIALMIPYLPSTSFRNIMWFLQIRSAALINWKCAALASCISDGCLPSAEHKGTGRH